MTAAVLDALRQAVGATHVLTEGDLAAYEQDRSLELSGALS